ncbi:hypothetical protein [Scytonema sp. HK-05]|uniref:hypothetical protein n=1 Tax=Scytonema sp. HK-05 TaxID=1137095 RepID=UPI000B1BF771|nr:hypothetical protein [Scytonema sp. HK-05]
MPANNPTESYYQQGANRVLPVREQDATTSWEQDATTSWEQDAPTTFKTMVIKIDVV